MKTNAQLKLTAVVSETKDKPVAEKSIEEIIGRPYKKQKLTPPHFPVLKPVVEETKNLRYWLNKLKKTRVKKSPDQGQVTN